MPRLLCLALVLTVLSACTPPNLDTLDYPQTEPKAKDLVGLYMPTTETRKAIRERGHYPERDISIRLSADGTFTCTGIPDWWMASFGKPSGGFITQIGNWKLIRQQEWWVVGLDFSSQTRFALSNTSLFLVGAKPPFTIRIILGDPDEGKAMDFTKHE